MIIKSLAELAKPDERGLHFTPFGIGPKMDAEAAAEYEQKLISSLELSDQVPETTRDSFERLRTIHSYGILCYDLYTVAGIRRALSSSRPCVSVFRRFMAGSSRLLTRRALSIR
jgi:hypothetical protein